jgi:tetratricopeptide (TPR) repeat protein
MVKGIDEIIGQGSSVEIGKVKIPLKPIYAFFYRLLHGPILSGGVHLKGEKIVVTACLKGGKYSGSWEISIDDIEKPPTSRFGQVIAMTDQLVCRIIALISQGGSPRWKAMSHYTRALGLYRETLLKREKNKLNLIKAKNEFSRALTDDSKFGQCYYNQGIIYDELKSNHAAVASFRKALESAPDNYHCYYQLARLYYNEKNYFDARWFCEQALTICPTEAEHWNLWAVIQYKKNYKVGEDDYKKKVDINDEVVQYFMNASALVWRALCKSIINGEKIPQCKENARICIRNMAKITGMRKEWRSRCLFKQAVFLDPHDNDLHFEAGKYFYRYYSDYRKNKIIKAYNAFKRVFEHDKEVGDPFSYWAYYINVNAQLYAKKGEQKYKEIVDEGFFYFLDAASEIIQNKKEEPEDIKIKIHEKQVSEALSIIKKKEEDFSSVKSPLKEKNEKDNGFLFKLIEILNDFKPITSEDDYDKEYTEINTYLENWLEKFSQYGSEFSGDFKSWVEDQADVKLAILNLEEIKKSTPKDSKNQENQEKKRASLMNVIIQFICPIDVLKKKDPKKLKILGLYRYLAEAYYISEKYKEALKIAREAVRLDPYNWEVRELLGRIYFALNDYQQAVNEFEISARLDELPPAVLIEILKKIGKVYEKNGKILRDPEQRKNAFNKAVEFFTDSLLILEDKSYGNNDEENGSQYIDLLAEIHFYLGTFYCELLNYDNAISHFKIAREMGYEILQTLMKIGWTYFECGDFNEAEQAFEKAESESRKLNKKGPREISSDGTSAEIKLGIAFSQVERTLHIGKKNLPEDKEPLNILKDAKKRIKKVTDTDEKYRLSSLYHECRGRFYLNKKRSKT